MATKPKYDPNGMFEVVPGKTIRHSGDGTLKTADSKPFDLSHLDAKRVEFLVDVKKAVRPSSQPSKSTKKGASK